MKKNNKWQLDFKSQERKPNGLIHFVTSEEKEAVEDHHLQVSILTSRNRDLIETNKKLTKIVDNSLVMAQQLLERTYYINQDLAKVVFNEFSVNPESALYGENYNDLVTVLKALRKVEYYHKPKEEDVYALYRAKLTDEKKLQSTLQYKEYELARSKREVEEKSRLLELKEIEVKEMQVKLESYRAEVKRAQEKERIFIKMLFDKKDPREETEQTTQGTEDIQRSRPVVVNGSQGVGIVIRNGEVTQRALSEEEMKNIEEMKIKYMNRNKSVRYVEQRKQHPVVPLLQEEEHLQPSGLEVEPPVLEEALSDEEKQALNEAIVLEMETIEEELPQVVEEKVEANEDKMVSIEATKKQLQEEVDKPIYLSLLEKKEEVEIEKDPRSKIDAWVCKDDEKVPLCYINYEIEDSKIFENIMGNKNKVYFIFDNKKHYNKGNKKFITWLYKAGKTNQIEFSFTMEDQLRVSGLNDLDRM